MIKKCYSAQSYKVKKADYALQQSIVNNSDKMIKRYVRKAHWNKCDFRARLNAG